MDRGAENRGEHDTPECRHCSSSLERHQNVWVCISGECPYRHLPLSWETTSEDDIARQAYPSTQASGHAISAEDRSATITDEQDGNSGDRMSLDGTREVILIWPGADTASSDSSREFPSNVNGTQGSHFSAAQDSAEEHDVSHGEATDSSEGDGRMDIDTIDVEVHQDATSSWVNERNIVGREERHSEVVQVLRSDILNGLAIPVPMVASEVEQVLELSDDEDMEE
ncbi:hypothetical protein FSARC_1264 [Fusarium sarcochroum]|uniref:Uncharacterized protein n=1 Tax=Fusarium sarcochroum TaxID=1208366 RepID=A0A8H4XFE7_9HYPO|nr:hypothetical protein FSARC_1264 [Fusarium sarcochroum]